MALQRSDVKQYLDILGVAIATAPQLSLEPVKGICAGRIVAYWPTKEESTGVFGSLNPRNGKLRAIGSDHYIPALIVAAWRGFEETDTYPQANLLLFLDPANHNTAIHAGYNHVAYCCYSDTPVQGCWTWIPNA